MTRLFAATGIALALLSALVAFGYAGRVPVAHAVVGAACERNEQCGDSLQVCRNNTCVSLENEPLEQLPVPPPPGETAPVRPGPGIANFIRYVYLFGISFIGVAAVVSIFYGGLKYFLSIAGGAKEDAKDILTSALLGLLLALGAYLLLRTINPALVSFEPIEGDLLQLTPPSTSNPLVIGLGERCYPGMPDACANGLSCQGIRQQYAQDDPAEKETVYRCLNSNLPPLGDSANCSNRPNACEPPRTCRNVSGSFVCVNPPAASGVPENQECVTETHRGQGNCGLNAQGRPLTCANPLGSTRGICRNF